MVKDVHSAGQRWVPYNGKIADITHADTLKHTLDLAAVLHAPGVAAPETRKIIALQVGNSRAAGTGFLFYYANEGAVPYTNYQTLQIALPIWVVIANGLQRLQYSLDTANDDWDLYCYGYVVEA